MALMPSRILHIGIKRDWRDVYDFASQPENMPKWAAGLAAELTRDGDEWVAEGGGVGKVRVRFSPANELGVLDHSVTMPNGLVVNNALRVVPNGDGAEVMFTLLQRSDMDQAAMEKDADAVRADLKRLRSLLEA